MMPSRCGGIAFAACLALVTSASVTIRWNAPRAQLQTPAPASHGTVVAVRGTSVTLRTPDGRIRSYTASAREAAVLRTLIGHTIAFKDEH